MRVLQVLGNSAGGIARHVADLATGFAGSSIEIETAAPSSLPVPIPGEVHHVQIPDGPLGHRKAISDLRSVIAGGDFDVVHAHGLRAGIDSAAAAGAIPSLVTIHNLVQPEVAGRLKAPLFRYAERLAVGRNDKVLCVSEQIAEHLRASVPVDPGKIEVTYLGVAQPEVSKTRIEARSEIGLTDQDKVVVTVARLAPQKALHVMFTAIAQLPDVHLLILGDGPQRDELQALGRELVGDRAHFLGFRQDVADIVAASDVFALSSVWEGVPIAAMEAALLGTAIVSTDVGGMSEIVSDGVSGRLVQRGDADAMAGAIAGLLDSPELRASMVLNAGVEVRKRFDRRGMLNRLETIYNEMNELGTPT